MKLIFNHQLQQKVPQVLLYMSLFFLALNTSCKKFITIDAPNTDLVRETVFADDLTAQAAMSAIYFQMINDGNFVSGGRQSVTIFGAFSSDELKWFVGLDHQQFFSNNIKPTNSINSNIWGSGYNLIYKANAILEGLSNSTKVSASIKKQLEGEAKFVRAFCHFYLVNLFGDVPLITTTDYQANKDAVRTPALQVYQQIIIDLEEGQSKLAADYSYSNNERVKPNKFAATALLARIYLYKGDWVNAEAQATTLINNASTYSLVPDANNVFLKNSQEAIWQLRPTNSNLNTNEGNTFIFSGTPNFTAVSVQLINAFELGDVRRTKWIGTTTSGTSTWYYPYKYKIQAGGNPLSEYSMVLRLAEQYLVRAEARAKQNNLAGAQSDLNVIRNRASLANTTAVTQLAILTAIEQERRIELFSEWGHRWLDLKRTSRADAVLGPIKAPNWQTTDVLYPIPQSEMDNNHNLTQNPGY